MTNVVNNVVPVTKESFSLLLRERKLQRQLTEANASEVGPVKNAVHGDKNEKDIIGKAAKKLPKGCTEPDINKDSKKEALLNNVDISGKVRLSQKEAFIACYHSFNCMKIDYYKMIEYLKKWFYKRTLKCGIPNETVINLWEGYSTGLFDDLNEMEEFCIESIYDFVENATSGSLTRAEYDEFTNNLRNICRRFTKITEKKL
ncbi:hypothetical protein C922_02594 [Plasmodium inui San Antonio 1]|uniref:Plasmodium RESA N-terminal domain-containing protein n=1 Tax=Plasmodium inui San Antonio 1 TaxID=1237626 RepID=W7A5K4_9APIC|nr:hypothetical protein C922_02594 [Plasmodium inui San Antonio 1]EUD67010.1 hypothetical protein C922_02594 [Plasmodium inui San Antonio 1]